MRTSFLSAATSATREALIGLTLGNAESVAFHPGLNYAYGLVRQPGRRVALVSGGGSGHEPMHASFIGVGGLDAACPGEVFASPNNKQVYEASKAVALPGGVLHIVKNYTGDRINFGIAAERLRADGIDVATVLVDDDLGSENADDGIGRRGTAATVILEKILGAAADGGLSLMDLTRLGEDVVENSRSIAVANRAHTMPHDSREAFQVSAGSLEYGVGIHGETAASTIQQPPLSELVAQMINDLLGALPAERNRSRYIVFVNGLGGVSNLELQHILVEAYRALDGLDIDVASAHTGTYVSALDMRGFSITLTRARDGWLPYWLAEQQTPGLPNPTSTEHLSRDWDRKPPALAVDEEPRGGKILLNGLSDVFEAKRAALNALDQISGDGDLGSNLALGMSLAARSFHGDAESGFATVSEELQCIAEAFLDEVGGSSGPFFGLLFHELAVATIDADESAMPARLAAGLRAGLAAIQRVGNAVPGDRTLVDALYPAVYVSSDDHSARSFSRAAVLAAIEGAAATATFTAKRGRASYVGTRVLGSPDPGSVAVVIVLAILLKLIDSEGVTELDELVDAKLLKDVS